MTSAAKKLARGEVMWLKRCDRFGEPRVVIVLGEWDNPHYRKKDVSIILWGASKVTINTDLLYQRYPEDE